MKIYIAGPMTGLPDLNFPAFNRAAELLRADGHTAINPVDINPDPNAQWQACMFRDLEQLDTCDAVLMLPGWENSSGAQIERLWAKRTGKTIMQATMLGCIEVDLMNRELT